MYNQVSLNDVEIENLLNSKFKQSRLEDYYKYCECRSFEQMSKLCRATLLYYLHGHKLEQNRIKKKISSSGTFIFSIPLSVQMFEKCKNRQNIL